MSRDQIITKTLDDMRSYLNSDEDSEPGSADSTDAYDSDVFIQESEPGSVGRTAEYDRDVFIPEMQKRLPAGDIVTCEDLGLEIECCPICHGFYPHYDMDVVRLADGRTGWICCAVRQALFPETAIADDSPEALMLRRIFSGDESGGQDA
jgi:hypothetical protein